jgi:hypothetical protein
MGDMAEEIRQIFFRAYNPRNIEYYQSQCFGKCFIESNLYGVKIKCETVFVNLQIRTYLAHRISEGAKDMFLRLNGNWTKWLRTMISLRFGGFYIS